MHICLKEVIGHFKIVPSQKYFPTFRINILSGKSTFGSFQLEIQLCFYKHPLRYFIFWSIMYLQALVMLKQQYQTPMWPAFEAEKLHWDWSAGV